MIRKALYGDFMEAEKSCMTIMGSFGFSGTEIIRQIQREIFKMSDLTPEQKADISGVIGEYDFRLTEAQTPTSNLARFWLNWPSLGRV